MSNDKEITILELISSLLRMLYEFFFSCEIIVFPLRDAKCPRPLGGHQSPRQAFVAVLHNLSKALKA